MASDDIERAVRDAHIAAKDARIAALFACACIALIGVLLMIDGQRNKWMAQQMQEVRRIFAEFQGLAVSYAGAEPAQAPDLGAAAADVRGVGGDGAAGVVADAAAGAGVDQASHQAARSANGQFARRAGMAGGPRGDG